MTLGSKCSMTRSRILQPYWLWAVRLMSSLTKSSSWMNTQCSGGITSTNFCRTWFAWGAASPRHASFTCPLSSLASLALWQASALARRSCRIRDPSLTAANSHTCPFSSSILAIQSLGSQLSIEAIKPLNSWGLASACVAEASPAERESSAGEGMPLSVLAASLGLGSLQLDVLQLEALCGLESARWASVGTASVIATHLGRSF
mmetsp:Transcript_88593/g.258950  ORF Transcript_88593/g.258950 Transcript_88593/m.258950 type:complete len:204 (-) Transcript_88593:61-672(-)